MADQLPMQPFRSGQRQISAELMNRLVDAVNYEARTQYDDTIETVAGVRHHFSDPGRRGFWAKLTSESGGQYAWTEQQLNGFTFSNLTYGRSGTTSTNFAKDPNGATGLAASTPVVWLTPGDPTQAAGVVSDNWLITGYAASSSSVTDASHTVAGIVNLSSGQWLGTGQKNIDSIGIGYNTGSPWAILTAGTGVFGGSSGLLTSNMDFWAQQLLVGTTSGTRATMYSTASIGPTGGYSVGTAKGFSAEHFTSGGAILLGTRPASAEGFEMDGTYSVLFDTLTPKIYTSGGTGEFVTQVISGFQTVRTGGALNIGNTAGGWAGGSAVTGTVSVVDAGGTSRSGQTTTLSGATFTAGILTDASGYSVSVSGSSLTGTVDGGTW
jgi:hypothetical protein